jgi:hypothetical protein
MKDIWNTPIPTQLQRDVALLAAYLHYEQNGPGFWDTIKHKNGSIVSVRWPMRPSWGSRENMAEPEPTDPC